MLISIRIGFALFLSGLSFSAASTDVLAVDAFLDAYSKFDQMVAESSLKANSDMPRVTAPAVASVIVVMSDSERFLVKAHYRLEHLNTLMDVCDKANRAVMSYLLFDLKSHVDVKADSATSARQVAIVMDRNAHAFQNELELLQPFLVRCLAKEIPLMTEFMSKLKAEELTDIRRAGVQQARMGIVGVIYGAVQAAGDKTLAKSYRTTLLHAVADNASQFSSLLPIAGRQQLLAATAAAQKTAPPGANAYLLTITEAMSDTNCTGLCNY